MEPSARVPKERSRRPVKTTVWDCGLHLHVDDLEAYRCHRFYWKQEIELWKLDEPDDMRFFLWRARTDEAFRAYSIGALKAVCYLMDRLKKDAT